VFVFEALKQVKDGVQILAVLPEVLRSGTFSGHWREAIAKTATINLVEPHGIFDETADIDVFVLGLTRRVSDKPNDVPWKQAAKRSEKVVSNFFDVHVGRVVPHRDVETGAKLPYIHPRSVEPWTITADISESRRHFAPGYMAPFVVIRRTSRPEQPYRAVATVVGGTKEVYVENHLIVCLPKDGKLASCLELMAQLKNETVNLYLNERIRCRHLTVGAVSAIPLSWSI
ncbi:MAG: SAM-dependent DNA methyltransferase, partial [Chthonomonadales bacterium]